MKILQIKVNPFCISDYDAQCINRHQSCYCSATMTDIPQEKTSLVSWTQVTGGNGVNAHMINFTITTTAGDKFVFNSSLEADMNVSNSTPSNTGNGFGLVY
ncbi:hypothetical protein I6H07_22770 (plasmid) [Hafnia alvei]|uniref:hypothetical protein n=1 Tax=Hafnia alvei TaxID=569 RepID=UPI000B74DB56|nr:hypothetical protein [Hafnia alvei]MBI0278567.1 hypothetical protein [Hafnia alvei]PNL03865.1 hypothetical protein CEQ28_000155 [Hafnia alvei]